MLTLRRALLLAGVLFSITANAGPHLIDCDAEKAARNAAMKATVGVHGACDPEKLADQKKDDAEDKLDDSRERLRDRNDDRDHKLRKDKD